MSSTTSTAGAAAVTPDGFAAWLAGRGYAEGTIRRARSTAAAFLTEHAAPRNLNPETFGHWLARQECTSAERARKRRYLTRLREHALDTLSPEVTAALRRDSDQRAATVAAFARWLTDAGMAPATVHHRANVAAAFLADHPAWGHVPEEEITAWIHARTPTRSTRYHYRGALRSLYRWAQVQGVTTTATIPRRGGPGTANRRGEVKTGHHMAQVPPVWDRYLDAWTNWLASAGRSDTMIYLREYQIRRFAADTPQVHPMRVSVDDLAAWMAGQMWANSTRHSFRTALRSFYGWAYKAGHIDHDPAGLLPSIRQHRAVPHPTPEAAIHEALAHADQPTTLMIQLAAQLGLRRAEIAQVHARDITTDDQGRKTLLVTGKGGHQRRLPVTGELAQTLSRIAAAAPDAYLFPGNTEEHLSPGHVGHKVSHALGPGWSCHSLRHRFATVTYAPRRDLFTVQTLLGHASPVTTRGYVQLPDDALREAVAAAALWPS